MKKPLFTLIAVCISTFAISQKAKTPDKEALLQELSANGCSCVDSVDTYNRPTSEIIKQVNECLDIQAGAYQMGSKMMSINNVGEPRKKSGKKQNVTISLTTDKNSDEYKKYYYEVEKYMMDHCPALKLKMAEYEKQSEKSFSKNKKALEYYDKGMDESLKEDFPKALEYFKMAVDEDPEFAFAWDNIGICYRQLGNYDKAIESYQKSLELDPNGMMPLQNIAVAYQYKKEYHKAINAYKRISVIDANNPEIYYGMGNIYTVNLNDYEPGLENLCKAYNIYVQQKSPYRTDAENLISLIYSKMKAEGKEDKFNEILKANNITANK